MKLYIEEKHKVVFGEDLAKVVEHTFGFKALVEKAHNLTVAKRPD